ncbi:hypothetical protein M5689_019346 [Euphorbia peplus]|nr:hypothetical protein M5689_019346 [Euphorbia peplus]
MINIGQERRIFKELGIESHLPCAPRYISITWNPPTVGWMKVNTDGALSGSPSLGGASASGIFRNYRGFPHDSFAFPVRELFTHIAELRATIMVVIIARDRGWMNLWMECDSLYVVSLFQARSRDVPWFIDSNWINCRNMISSMNFVISHIYREGNGAADALSKYGQTSSIFVWWHSCPSFCSSFVLDDLSEKEQFRFR